MCSVTNMVLYGTHLRLSVHFDYGNEHTGLSRVDNYEDS